MSPATIRRTVALGLAVAAAGGGTVAAAAGGTAAAAAPFRPDDTGALGRPGGWRSLQWNFAGRYGVRAPQAWANLIAAGRPGGAGVTIAVLDTGVASADRPPYRRSPDLAGARFVDGYDFVDGDRHADDGDGHGTHVASTIAEQTDNGLGLTGLAYGARIMPIRVLSPSGAGSSSVIARGIRYAAEHGAKIINLSLTFRRRVSAARIPQVMEAIDEATRRGSLVVAAAGNFGRRSVSFPARAEQAVAVGATTDRGCVARYSDVGRGLDLVAPGGGRDGAGARNPRCRAGRNGRPIAQVTVDGSHHRHFGIYGYVGTSMATPHVSAAAALVVASGVLGPDPPPSAIARRLERTARDLGPRGYDRRYGWGLLDAGRATSRGVR
jgi:serine protease